RTGKYSKGWRVRTTKGQGFVDCVVYNSTSWQLTHLLEKSHLTRNGGRTKAFVHLKPVEEKYVNEYIKNVEQIIKNGG
ncbi:MAG: HK97 gp10 family phage protein, partial [Bacilli bacterium]|nr:HK97 gp10 family phage protein [Bacilli bacterium]